MRVSNNFMHQRERERERKRERKRKRERERERERERACYPQCFQFTQQTSTSSSRQTTKRNSPSHVLPSVDRLCMLSVLIHNNTIPDCFPWLRPSARRSACVFFRDIVKTHEDEPTNTLEQKKKKIVQVVSIQLGIRAAMESKRQDQAGKEKEKRRHKSQ